MHLSGLDVVDPGLMKTDHRDGADVPAWILDTDYNGLAAGTHEQVAVKVIDDRGNALLVVLKHLAEADT